MRLSPRHLGSSIGSKLMTKLMDLFDDYNRQARLYPALLALLPPLIALLAWFPSLLTSNVGTTFLTLVVSCGLLFALAVFSRSCGKLTEARLLKLWGGWPTTQWLRHSDTHLAAATKTRYHKALVKHVPGWILPTSDEERSNPSAADDAYRSAVDWLKERCRGKGFPLVIKENIEYGFRRNMRGIRPFAFGVIALAIIGTFAAFAHQITRAGDWSISAIFNHAPIELVGATALLLVALACWMFFVTDLWVREAGDQYARALLSNCDVL
jgi:hypothetical protein